MNNISNSATKLVLLFLVIVLGILTLMAGYHAIFTGDFNDACKAIFASFAGALTLLFGYYFNSKGDPNLPYGGK